MRFPFGSFAAILLTSAVASPASAALTHQWPADGNAEDDVGSADGTISGGVTYGDGLFGQGFVFDGTSGVVNFGDEAGNFGSSDFTIAFVIRTQNTTRIEGVLGKRSICAFSPFWDIRSTEQGHLGLEYYSGTPRTNVGVSIPINDGLFHTVVFTRAGNVLTSYVDGLLDQQAEYDFVANADNDAPARAGTSACTGLDGTFHFQGTLDEIRFADTADPDLLPAFFHCGDANLSHTITATDALAGLQTSVGTN